MIGPLVCMTAFSVTVATALITLLNRHMQNTITTSPVYTDTLKGKYITAEETVAQLFLQSSARFQKLVHESSPGTVSITYGKRPELDTLIGGIAEIEKGNSTSPVGIVAAGPRLMMDEAKAIAERKHLDWFAEAFEV
jgi:hypothetical protein